MSIRKITGFKLSSEFARHIAELGLSLPIEERFDPFGPLADPMTIGSFKVDNRFCILPMEGWDGTPDGSPTEWTERRWKNFGASGAKLIWGGEAVAVRHDGRANPRQLMISQKHLGGLARLRELLIAEHRRCMGSDTGLLVGLQLTHSGRYSKPNDHHRPEPKIVYRHPVLDGRVGADESSVLSDAEVRQIIDDFVRAAETAHQAGFSFVDIKHCHGYLGHEFLSAVDRPGPFGGSLENRLRFLREIITGIRQTVPELMLGVRLSAFDWVPFCRGPDGKGIPVSRRTFAFGSDSTGTGVDLAETKLVLESLERLGVSMVCITAGSPYYNPHVQRPALFPPSDGYDPPEDPLVGVIRQMSVCAELKRHVPQLAFIGSGMTYLQDWFPNVAQSAVRTNMMDFVGLGRMVLSYPNLPADLLSGRPLDRKRICRTFSDCTTAPRNGLISGCFPLDPNYKISDDAIRLAEIKRQS